ncbi:hypothetical protein EYF80_011959 [Liparis tanakae]|uniref:Uncharacterized protein n=1 Tax=Liparis tanakae TaxID=230148 RepID=A0A4Z2IIT4_9TELE|nr:hypothetical protein EYF80_011959 [Liparis tanakae]
MMSREPHPSSTAEHSRFSSTAVTAIHQRLRPTVLPSQRNICILLGSTGKGPIFHFKRAKKGSYDMGTKKTLN